MTAGESQLYPRSGYVAEKDFEQKGRCNHGSLLHINLLGAAPVSPLPVDVVDPLDLLYCQTRLLE